MAPFDLHENGEISDPIIENPFDIAESRILFNAMDQLQTSEAAQLGDIEVPQLVIVGGQSTGKSSLLQALIDVPFPVDKSCCTRFATRIVSRRTPPGSKNRVVITIVPGPVQNAVFNYTEDLTYQDYKYEAEELTGGEFKEIMEDVTEHWLGIKKGRGQGKRNFATEVLKIELSGPNRSFFSVLDIPGVVVADHDINGFELDGVRQMAIEYMQRPANLVICVVDSRVNLNNQSILRLAQEYVQPQMLIGVFTKCDILDVSDDIDEVIRNATGETDDNTKKMHHGWFVVRNRTLMETALFDLDAAEAELFATEPWNRIPQDRRGTYMLRSFVSHLLCKRIRLSFPKFQEDIKKMLLKERKAREALGEPRPEYQQKLRYLLNIVREYELAANKTLEGSSSHGSGQDTTLRANVITENTRFDEQIREDGHKYDFEEIEPKLEPVQAEPQTLQLLLPPTPDSSPKSKVAHEASKKGRSSAKELRRVIKDKLAAFPSRLPGHLNIDVLPDLYRIQTQKWLVISQKHIETISDKAMQTSYSILQRVCEDIEDSSVFHQLTALIIQFSTTARAHALSMAEKEFEVERDSLMQCTNQEFYKKVMRLRSIRYKRVVEPFLRRTDLETIDLQAIFHDLWGSLSPSDTKMEDECHDMLKTYYELSIPSFIDRVNKCIIEDLISGPQSALGRLSTGFIADRSTEEIEQLAREDGDTLTKRATCNAKIERLTKAETVVKRALEQTRSLSTTY